MSEHLRRDSDGLLGVANKYWPLVLAVISVIAMATTIKNKVDNHEARIASIETTLITVGRNTDRLVYELLDKK